MFSLDRLWSSQSDITFCTEKIIQGLEGIKLCLIEIHIFFFEISFLDVYFYIVLFFTILSFIFVRVSFPSIHK